MQNFSKLNWCIWGHQLLIEDKTSKITPMKSRVEAILKLNAPKTPKGCKQFCGMVNYFINIFTKITGTFDSNIPLD